MTLSDTWFVEPGIELYKVLRLGAWVLNDMHRRWSYSLDVVGAHLAYCCWNTSPGANIRKKWIMKCGKCCVTFSVTSKIVSTAEGSAEREGINFVISLRSCPTL
jgi:hypothetical protein